MPRLPEFSDFIRAVRELDYQTAQDAADALGWSVEQWNAFEQGSAQAVTPDNVKTAAPKLHVQPWIIQYMFDPFCARPFCDLYDKQKAMGAVVRKSRGYLNTSITDAVKRWIARWAALDRPFADKDLVQWRDAWCQLEDEGRVAPLLHLTFGANGAPWQFLDEVPPPVQWAILWAATEESIPHMAGFCLAALIVATGNILAPQEGHSRINYDLFGRLIAYQTRTFDVDHYANEAVELCMFMSSFP